MIKKNPSDKINSTKNALFFLSRAPTNHNFTFNLWFLSELKHKVRLSKLCVGLPIFDAISFLLLKIFVQQKYRMHGLLTLKRHNSFQN